MGFFFKGLLLSISLLASQLSSAGARPGISYLTTTTTITTTESTVIAETITTSVTSTVATEGTGRPTACTKLPYNLFLPLSNYAPAEAYCSSKYPAANAETFVVCANTVTETIFAPTVLTITTTETLEKNKVKRSTTPTASATCNAQCNMFSSLAAEAQSIVSTICRCIEMPTSTTITVSAEPSSPNSLGLNTP